MWNYLCFFCLNQKGITVMYSFKTLILQIITFLCFFCKSADAQIAEMNLLKLNLSLPTVSKPIANYVHSVRVGNLLFLAGKGPQLADGSYTTGKLGQELSIEQGYAAAQLTALWHLAVLRKELGDLSKVKRFVKVLGFVNCIDSFGNQPEVINGYSDLMVSVLGDKAIHARSAIGTNSLPRNMAVEIEAIVEITD
jgi:enamine deaminase RidA (YjgF/YER057c/UK114 family)